MIVRNQQNRFELVTKPATQATERLVLETLDVRSSTRSLPKPRKTRPFR